MITWATEINLRARRKAGQMLRDMPKAVGTKSQLVSRGVTGGNTVLPPVNGTKTLVRIKPDYGLFSPKKIANRMLDIVRYMLQGKKKLCKPWYPWLLEIEALGFYNIALGFYSILLGFYNIALGFYK